MGKRIPDSIIDEIERKVDILDVVGNYVNLSRKGDRWWGLCPFHSEKTPSFSVSPDTNLFYCFGCHKGGGVFQFLMEMEGLSFPESVRRLGEKVGVDIPETGEEETARDNRKALLELYGRVSKMFCWLLLNHSEAAHAREYLARRGINNEIAERFGIGWAPSDGEWLFNFLLSKNYTHEFLAESGLFSRKSASWAYFVDRLMFPVMPDMERVVAFSGRTLSDKEPKYINSPETQLYRKSRELYGMGQAKQAIRKKRTAVLCEGNLDVLSCVQAGIEETIAPLGTAFTEDQAALIKRQADNIVLMFDADGAGRKASIKAAILAEQIGLNVQAVPLPDSSDPSDMLKEKGEEYLKKRIQTPVFFFDFLLNYLISAKTDISGEAQEEALEELTPYLESVGSEVRQEAYLRQLADAMNADPVTVIREFRNRKPIRSSIMEKKAGLMRRYSLETADDFTAGDELYLMAAVAVRSEYFTALRKMLAPEHLRDKRALCVYRIMDELSVGGNVPRTDAILTKLKDETLNDFILRQASSAVYDERAEETIATLIRGIKARSLSEERAELVKGLNRDKNNDSGLSNERILRIQEIDRQILELRQGKDVGNQV